MILTVPQDRTLYPTLGGQVCDWIEENLVFGPGDLRGQPAVVDEETKALIYRMYEVFPKEHPQAGRRRFKRVGISLAKGLAKTEKAAWIAACELAPTAPVRCVGWEKRGKAWEPVGGPVTDPFIVMVAYIEEQSNELGYGALKAILEYSPIVDQFDIGLERIMRKSGAGKAVSLSLSPNARDGARTTFAHCDETHLWMLPRLRQAYQTIRANLPKRKGADAWMLETTTAFEPGAGSVAEGTMDYAKAVKSGAVADSALFYYHRQAGGDSPIDLSTRDAVKAAVIEASGPVAEWRDIDAIVGEWADPTTNLAWWERVWLNRVVQGASQAFDVVRWKALARPKLVEHGALITIGFDGGQFHDSTGLVCTEILTGYQWVAAVWERPAHLPKEAAWKVPAEEVDATVRGLFSTYTVWRMYADPPYWQSYIKQWIGEFGEERVIEWWTNRRRQMAAALEGFDTAIREGTLSHDGSAVLERHIGNSRRLELAQRDDLGRPLWLIQKERPDSPHKMDLAMAAVLSRTARADAVASGLLVPVDSLMAEWIA